MIESGSARPSLNRGRYLVHNSLAYSGLVAIDSALSKLVPASSLQLSVGPRRILVCNIAHIGDLLVATSVIPVLKARFPGAKLGFFAHPSAAPVLDNNPNVDWVHRVEHWKLNRRPL